MKTNAIFQLILVFLSLGTLDVRSSVHNHAVMAPGDTDSIYSKILSETRVVRVYLPEESNLCARQTYPVVYLLDGDAHFNTVMNIIQQLSETNMNLVLPKMILVGIQNTDRMRDLTPTHVSQDPHIPDSGFLRTSGGGENFTAFLQYELIPFIDAKYPAAPYRILIGHSDGGLFCVNTLMNHTPLFNGYIAIDPSMDWDDNKILNRANEILSHKDFTGTSLFLSIANQGYSDTETYKDNAASFTLAKHLDLNRSNHLRYKWQYYREDNHGSVPLVSEYDGLRFLFDFYNPKIPYVQFRDPGFDSDGYLVSHFKRVSAVMGYTVPPPEMVINWLGYLFVMENQIDKAYRMFRLNTENYPTSWNAFDSMGEILLMKGDTAQSVTYYKKSVGLNPENENAKKIIERLQKGATNKP